jgi:hypothetical protein
MTITLTDPWGGSHTLTRQPDGSWQGALICNGEVEEFECKQLQISGSFLWAADAIVKYWIPDDIVSQWKAENP